MRRGASLILPQNTMDKASSHHTWFPRHSYIPPLLNALKWWSQGNSHSTWWWLWGWLKQIFQPNPTGAWSQCRLWDCTEGTRPAPSAPGRVTRQGIPAPICLDGPKRSRMWQKPLLGVNQDCLCVKRSPAVLCMIIQEFSIPSPCARENVSTGVGRKML